MVKSTISNASSVIGGLKLNAHALRRMSDEFHIMSQSSLVVGHVGNLKDRYTCSVSCLIGCVDIVLLLHLLDQNGPLISIEQFVHVLDLFHGL